MMISVMRHLILLIVVGNSFPAMALDWQDVRVVGLLGNAAAIEVEGARHVIRIGERNDLGVDLVAIKGQAAVLRINDQQRQIPLGRVISKGFSKPDVSTETIAINSRGQYLTAGSINGRSVNMLVDTGATSVAMNTAQARSLGINFSAGQVGSSRTAGGIVKSYSVMLDRVKLGSIEVKKVRAAVLEGIYPTYVLLGMTFLNHVELQESEGVMTLTKKY